MVNHQLLSNFRDQFIARNGQRIDVPGRGIFFETGARMDYDPMGMTAEPEAFQPLELAQNILLFHQTKLNRAVQEFDSLRKNLEGAAVAARRSGFSPPDEEAIGELLELRKTVRKLADNVAAAKAEVDKLTPKESKRDARLRARNAEDCDNVIEKLRGIRI